MARPRAPLDEDLLMAQTGWVRNLAHSLVRDPVRAEDVAQETLLVALESPPPDAPDARRLRAWLGRVAFNLAQAIARRNRERKVREEQAARLDFQGSTADDVARGSVVQVVMEAVAELEEPYREAVRLRYFEGISATEIARRLGTSDNAIRKRLWRARERLRRQLDLRHRGDRPAWFQAWVGLLPWRARDGARPSWPLVAGLAAGTAVLGGLTLVLRAPDSRTPAAAGALRVSEAPDDAPEALVRPPASVSSPVGAAAIPIVVRARTPVAPPRIEPEPTAPSEASHPGLPRIVGRVVDPAGTGVGGLELSGTGSSDPAPRSGPDGRFELVLDTLAGTGRIEARGAGWVTFAALPLPELPARSVAEGRGRPGGSESPEGWIVVAPDVQVAGRVVDAIGNPLEGVSVTLVSEAGFLEALDGPELLASRPIERRAETGPDGGFVLAGWPSWDGLSLAFAREDLGQVRIPVPRVDRGDLEVRFGEPSAEGVLLTGRVLSRGGVAVAGARLLVGEERTRTDRLGRFHLALAGRDLDRPLVVEHERYVRATVSDLRNRAALEPSLDLHLTELEPQDEVRGRVVDAAHRGVAGWQVLLDPTTAGETAQAAWRLGPQTDAEGRFTVRTPRGPEGVVVLDPGSLLVVRAERGVASARGPREVSFPVPADAWTAWDGTVVDESGVPVPGAEAAVVPEGAGPDSSWIGSRVLTDDSGGFHLQGVPREGVALRLRHPAGPVRLVAAVQAGGTGSGATPLHRLPGGGYLRIEGARAGDSVALLDGAGRVLEPRDFLGARSRVGLRAGRSRLLALPAGPVEVVVYEGSAEVLRTEVTLGRGELTTLQP